MQDQRNVGEGSCDFGDGMDQRAQSLMFMMMMMMNLFKQHSVFVTASQRVYLDVGTEF